MCKAYIMDIISMKRFILLLWLLFYTTIAFAQTELSLTDVQIYKSDGGFTSDENWNSEEAETAGIFKKSEIRSTKIQGFRDSFTFNYWTWKGDLSKSEPGKFIEVSESLGLMLHSVGDTLNMFVTNYSENYLLIRLDALQVFFCANDEEGVTNRMLPGIGNSLRSSFWSKHDYALIPPSKCAFSSFYSLEKKDIFPASLPKNTIIQMSLYGAFSTSDPLELVSNAVNGKVLTMDDVKYFTMDSYKYSNILSDFISPLVGFEARYHFKVR